VPGGFAFPATRRSVLERLRDPEPERRRLAFGDLAGGYWKPLYKHFRLRWRLEPADAEDAVQGFLAEAWDGAYFDGYDPARARFRTFLRVCADGYASKRRRAERALKRGGGAVVTGLDFRTAEGEVRALDPADPADPDEAFRRETVRALFERALERARAELEEAGKLAHWRLLERCDLEPADARPSYATLAAEAGVPVTTVTNRLAAARRVFRRHALELLRDLCGSDAEFREEARALFGVEVP
jgi:DNA-directed RNA polymerase specialized sigma24 family protein